MVMRPTTLRFSDQLWRLITTSAEREGVSASEYIRAAVLMRVTWDEAHASDPADWDRAVAAARQLLADDE